MKELSLHILDIVQNSIKAGAKNIEILIDENEEKNLLTIEINDNGCGMSEEFLKKVKDPFVTTRTTRKMGMGISLFEAAAVQCGGGLDIESQLGVGTKVTYFYECLLPYNNKVLEVKDMLNVIAFSSCNEVISKLYKRIFAHELSTYEVKAKLKCKEINEEHINLVISFLKSEGHLKEEDFINHYKEIYQYKKGYKAFKRFLESKHISDYSINKAMLSYNENEEYVYEYANKFIKSKTNSNKMIKAKLIASLTNKGFSSEVINKVIDKLEFDDDIINLKKEIVKYVKKYPDDKYKVISKLASKGYNVNKIKKVMEEGMYFEN